VAGMTPLLAAARIASGCCIQASYTTTTLRTRPGAARDHSRREHSNQPDQPRPYQRTSVKDYQQVTTPRTEQGHHGATASRLTTAAAGDIRAAARGACCQQREGRANASCHALCLRMAGPCYAAPHMRSPSLSVALRRSPSHLNGTA